MWKGLTPVTAFSLGALNSGKMVERGKTVTTQGVPQNTLIIPTITHNYIINFFILDIF